MAPDRLRTFANILPEDDAFLDLIDCSWASPKVRGIPGWNFYVYHIQLDVTPRAATASPANSLAPGQHTRQRRDRAPYPAAALLHGRL